MAVREGVQNRAQVKGRASGVVLHAVVRPHVVFIDSYIKLARVSCCFHVFYLLRDLFSAMMSSLNWYFVRLRRGVDA